MTFIAVRCPDCQSEQIVKRGKSGMASISRKEGSRILVHSCPWMPPATNGTLRFMERSR